MLYYFLHQVFFILSCVECIHVPWCTTVRNKSIIIIAIIIIRIIRIIIIICIIIIIY